MSPQSKALDEAGTAAPLGAGLFKGELGANVVQVDDRLYDARKLAAWHPGGEVFVRAFAGLDASEAFLSYHRRRFPHAKMSSFAVGTQRARKALEVDADYLELCELVEKVLPRHKSFAPASYYVKISVLLAAAVGLELYMHTTATYTWPLSLALGLLMALIGLNIQHDANHGAVSRSSWVNRLLGMTQNWIGGSAIDWIHQHVVQHHVNCNDVTHDPDIAGSDLLRLNPMKPLLVHHAGQHLYMFLMLLLFGFSITVESLGNSIKGFHHTKFSSLLSTHRVFETLSSLFFFSRWILLPLYQVPSWHTLASVVPMFVAAGYYLAFFFIISHNFVGVAMFDAKASPPAANADAPKSFLHRQVASSSNVGGAWLCFLNGGLNYQIEHHLFPRISHTHYPTIAPVVREFCLAKGLPYVHFASVGENMASCVDHLSRLGSELAYSRP